MIKYLQVGETLNKAASPMQTFLAGVAKSYGNPNARWLKEGERLAPGQKVRVFVQKVPADMSDGYVQEAERLLDAKATGKKRGGEHIVTTVINGRKWTFGVRINQILVRW